MNTVSTQAASIYILLVEDDDVDAEMVYRALRPVQQDIHIERAMDGLQALRLLHDTQDQWQLAEFQFILLDMRLPFMDGNELLDMMASDPQLATFPTIVMVDSELFPFQEVAQKKQVITCISKRELASQLAHYIKLVRYVMENLN